MPGASRAVRAQLPSDEVLELASLVLSTSEYEEFRHAVKPGDDTLTRPASVMLSY
jgi:hypothetical protein